MPRLTVFDMEHLPPGLPILNCALELALDPCKLEARCSGHAAVSILARLNALECLPKVYRNERPHGPRTCGAISRIETLAGFVATSFVPSTSLEA